MLSKYIASTCGRCEENFRETANRNIPIAIVYLLSALLALGPAKVAEAQSDEGAALRMPVADSSSAKEHAGSQPVPHNMSRYRRLARGWNTWDVHSVTTHVLLPEGLAIHIGLEHNSTEGGDAFLPDALIGRLTPGAEQVFPGEHSWDGSSTDLRVSWKGHSWRIQSARDGDDLVLLATPLPSQPISALPPTIVFSVNFLWNRPGTALKHPDYIETRERPALCRSTVLAQDQDVAGRRSAPIRTRGISICPWRAHTSPPTSRSPSVSAAVNLARLQRSSLSSTGNIACTSSPSQRPAKRVRS